MMCQKEDNVLTEDGKIVVTEAYCHNGHDLISKKVKVSGYPSINLLASDGEKEEMVYLSAVDGDHKKKGGDGFDEGKLLTISCPVCREELDNIAPCDCVKGSKFVAIYLNKKRCFSSCVGICNSWQCHRSFMNSAWKIISRFADSGKI